VNRKQSATPQQTIQQQLEVGAQIITYSLIFANRKSVGITIRPDMSVDVRAPESSSLEAVAEIMRQRAPWILRHLQKFAQTPPKQSLPAKPKGSTYQFLGQSLPLKVAVSADNAGGREEVKLEQGALYLWAKEPKDRARVDALLEKWSREQAERIFVRKTIMLFLHFKEYRLHMPAVAVRRMKARWGSCSADGNITLNSKLIHLEEPLIDYVIMHELCHLIEHNHSKNYYGLLTRMMPDWEQRRQRLNEVGMPE
jgi:predicted metal-dependent hydrolase